MNGLQWILVLLLAASIVGWLTAKHVRSAGVLAEVKDLIAREPLTPAEHLDDRLGELSQQPTIPIMWEELPRRTAITETVRRRRLDQDIESKLVPFGPVWRAR